MSETELMKALRREGEERAREHWQDAEKTVTERRHEIEAQEAEMRAAAEHALQAEAEKLRGELILAAQAESKKSRLLAEAELGDRLFVLARGLLPELAIANRDKLWQAFCAELPQAEWATLVVHPEDRALAEKSFPEATVACDDALGGGMIAVSADGAMRVDNSLSCRLKRAWPDLLPELMNLFRRQVEES